MKARFVIQVWRLHRCGVMGLDVTTLMLTAVNFVEVHILGIAKNHGSDGTSKPEARFGGSCAARRICPGRERECADHLGRRARYAECGALNKESRVTPPPGRGADKALSARGGAERGRVTGMVIPRTDSDRVAVLPAIHLSEKCPYCERPYDNQGAFAISEYDELLLECCVRCLARALHGVLSSS